MVKCSPPRWWSFLRPPAVTKTFVLAQPVRLQHKCVLFTCILFNLQYLYVTYFDYKSLVMMIISLNSIGGLTREKNICFLLRTAYLLKINFTFLYPYRPTQANRLCPSLMTVHIQEGKVNTREKEALPNLPSTEKSLNDHINNGWERWIKNLLCFLWQLWTWET